MFPNFNAWHKVPEDATIPARTPYFTAKGGDFKEYLSEGWREKYFPRDRNFDREYYTEKPIPSPEEEKIEKRARAMYYEVPDSDVWEYLDGHVQEAWLNLARKYVEK